MSESFIPLVPVTTASHETAFTTAQSKGLAPGAAPGTAGPENETGAKPLVTLQRNGETVSVIRVQCGCGRVIELNCTY